jgi:hypothetical protein
VSSEKEVFGAFSASARTQRKSFHALKIIGTKVAGPTLASSYVILQDTPIALLPSS